MNGRDDRILKMIWLQWIDTY